MEPEPFDPDLVEAVAHARAASLDDLVALPVEVEVRLLRGLLGVVKIIGLRESAARESRERVRSAIKAAGMQFPERSLLINLAPAELRKEGPGLDLAIAAAILAVTGQVPQAALDRRVLWGELALDGRLRPLRGAIPVALLARQEERELVAPRATGQEVARVPDLTAALAGHMQEVVGLLQGGPATRPATDPAAGAAPARPAALWDTIIGQDAAKEAVLVAAAGGHHLLLTGPPGSGKSMLARSLGTLLPDLSEHEALEVACIHSAAGLPLATTNRRPPFRAPHCSVTMAGMAGGGFIPRPGEITLAHRGVLFLDELPHYQRAVYDLLRTPLEEGAVNLSRAGRAVRLPARFQLVAAMNPCPCGNAGEPDAACSCSATRVAQYRQRISGPVLDRIDCCVRVPFVPAEQRQPSRRPPEADRIRRRVAHARERMRRRNGGRLNADLPPERLGALCALDAEASDWLLSRVDRLRLSMRAHHRMLRVARTLADLEDVPEVRRPHLARALAWRNAAPDR